MNHKGWHSRGYLPHFDSAETVQFVTFRLADSLPRAVAEALAKLADNLAETDHKLDSGLGACWLKEPPIARLVEDAIMHFDGERYRLLHGASCPTMSMWLLRQSMDIVSVPLSGAGSRSPPTERTRCSVAVDRSGIATISIDSFATRGICRERLTTSRTIRSKVVWRLLQLIGSGARLDAAHERAGGSRSGRS